MSKLLGASMLVIVAILGLVFAIGFLVLLKLNLPMGLTMALTGGFAVAIVLLQYCLGPMIIDYIVKVRWTSPDEMGYGSGQWLAGACGTFRIPMPRIGIIEEAAPNAFTYGHGAYDARVVVTRGLIDMLSPDELRAVVAHELGHIRNRDFIVMTMVQALVLALWTLYYTSRSSGRNNWYIVICAYLAYWASYYASLLLSRIREYMADYSSAQITGNPNHLSYALVKIAYGLAKTQTVGGATVPVSGGYRAPAPPPVSGQPASLYSYDQGAEAQLRAQIEAARYDDAHAIAARAVAPPPGAAAASPKKAPAKQAFSAAQLGAFGVMGVSSMRAAVAWSGADGLANPDTFTTAARWELFNPWGRIGEFFSTHPLTALRIKALQKLNRLFNQPDAFDFSKIRPATYKGFARDLALVSLPWVGLIVGGAVAGAAIAGSRSFDPSEIFMPLAGFSGGRLLVLLFSYMGDFKPTKVIRLLGEVEVSHVNPIPAALEGTFTGRISPGIAWASDYIVQDDSGFLACLFRRPLGLMKLWFGLTSADRYVGRRVRVYGWYRRFNAPYLEIHHFEVLDTGEIVTANYFPWAVAGNLLLTVLCVVAIVMFHGMAHSL
ncbi:MAG: M48 family metalloprotease [Fimbriimonas sp.]|nr:M48 family metalloprotease [Fimbriimonas sp.]